MKPIEFNHAGEKLYFAKKGDKFRLWINRPTHVCDCWVEEVNEENETITVTDGHQSHTMSFKDWELYHPEQIQTK